EFFHLRPTPLDEFGLMPAAGMRDVDFAVIAGETQRVPLLLLAAVFAAPRIAGDAGRNIVGEPFVDLAELLDRADARFLVKLAQSRLVGIFVLVDAALRHLPRMLAVDVLGSADAAADEHMPGMVHHEYSSAGTIGEGVVGGHSRHSVHAF